MESLKPVHKFALFLCGFLLCPHNHFNGIDKMNSQEKTLDNNKMCLPLVKYKLCVNYNVIGKCLSLLTYMYWDGLVFCNF